MYSSYAHIKKCLNNKFFFYKVTPTFYVFMYIGNICIYNKIYQK